MKLRDNHEGHCLCLVVARLTPCADVMFRTRRPLCRADTPPPKAAACVEVFGAAPTRFCEMQVCSWLPSRLSIPANRHLILALLPDTVLLDAPSTAPQCLLA